MANASENTLIQALFNNTEDAASAELDKLASANPEAAQALEDLEKIAAAEGIDLNDVPEDEIVKMINEALTADAGAASGAEEQIKVASPQGELPAGVGMEKVAAADFLGRVQAQAMFEEFNALTGGHEKVASAEDFSEGDLNKLAQLNAYDILHALGGLDAEAHAEEIADAESREKVASMAMTDELSEEIGNRTAQMLDAAGWDVTAIQEALASHEG